MILLLLKGKILFFTVKGKISKLIYKLYDEIIMFLQLNRINGHEQYFGFTNILYKITLYEQYWNLDNYQNIYKQIFVNGLEYQTKSRQIQTAFYSSTIGHTRYPQFVFRGSYKILPRPYPTF